MAETTLREALNKVEIYGVLKEKNLEVKSGDKGRFITGHVIVQTDEHNAHRVNVFSFEKTSKGDISGVYKGLVTVKDTFVSLADCSDQGLPASDATKVVISNGRFALNEYYDDKGELKSNWVINTSFISQARDSMSFDPHATFEVEGFISAIRTKDEETKIELIVPIYGGNVIPLTFDVTKLAADYISDNYERGQTGLFRGNLINIADVEIKPYQGFGEGRPTKVVTYKRSITITGGENNPYDEDNAKTYKSKDIKEALIARDEYLEKLKDKASKPKETKTTTSSGSSFNW